ncbi:MAG: aminopeptidase P family protein [Erysipelotrichales bacterium]|nr:aminopeptidase P family protein [Erysipelotrichales bacterium]
MNNYTKRVDLLRESMKSRGMDFYLIPTGDYHMSEYASEYFGFRKWLSGFTGSAGTMLVTSGQAYLWTDGRYFIQAQRQLEGSGIVLMRTGDAGVPDLDQFLKKELKKGQTLGFDGKCVSLREGELYQKIAEENGAFIDYDHDLSKDIWTDGRPELPEDPAWSLDVKWAGESRESKVKRVFEKLKELGADAQVLTSLDDIAWLLNVRGNDVPNNPVVLSYALLEGGNVKWYVKDSKVSAELRDTLKGLAEVCPYGQIYEDVKHLTGTVQIDPGKVNFALYRHVKGKVLLAENPELMMKAVKNDTEIKNLKKAHLYDGVALTKFIYWLKKTIREREITEWDATEKLEELRRAHPHCLDLSFPSIGAYNANAAMMHYSASKENAAVLHPEGMYLIDSGGQYYEGTTDVTRTIILGRIPAEWKRNYSLVLKGHLRLAMAKFLYGCRGTSLDILTRGPLWDLGIDYKCGTGHGVGYLLNVHEAPNGFRWRIVPERNDSCVLEANMVTTDEPGVYIEGSHGIRIENELVSRNLEKNEYGQFMGFEIITLAPIDRKGIDPKYLSDAELNFLNRYHAAVYRKLERYMTKEERAWLKKETAPLKRR